MGKLQNQLKAYEVIISFMDPSKALVTLYATDEDNAKEQVTNHFDDLIDLEIDSIAEVAQDVPLEDIDPNRTLN